MSSSMRSAKNNSLIAQAPHPSFRNEFTDNQVRVGHRAPHQPDVQTRDTFWSQQINHNMASFGISGQCETASANRFISFRRNRITGMNGIGIWGLGNGDVLVEGNQFEHVEQPITYDFFPDNRAHPTVQNVVVRGNTPALGPAPAPPPPSESELSKRRLAASSPAAGPMLPGAAIQALVDASVSMPKPATVESKFTSNPPVPCDS